MRLYIVADMEGATGVVHRDDLVEDGGHHYIRARRLLTGDINACVDAAVAAGVTEAVISEGHAHMRNVDIDELHPAARLVRGPASWAQRPLCQASGLARGFDLAIFIGFHSRAGTPRGLLSHTWAGAIVHELRINGRPAGETAINAALCGDFDIPVAMVCGADDLAREAVSDLGDVETVITKQAMGFNLASCWGPRATKQRIADGTTRAIQRLGQGAFSPYRPGRPVVVELEVHKRDMADKMAGVSELERVGERTLRAQGPDASTALSAAWRGVTESFREAGAWLR